MEYSFLVEYYEKLEKVSSKIEKTNIIADLLQKSPSSILPKVVLLIEGIVYPKFTQMELGVATQTMIKALSKATGFSTSKIEEIYKKLGDLGLTAEECLKMKKQLTLLRKKLTIEYIFDSLRKLALISGEGSQEKKLNIIIDLLLSSSPKEAKYVVRTILEELRVGVAEGLIRDAIVQAFLAKREEEKWEEFVEAVDYAWNIISDFGEVAKIAKESGIEGLRKVRVTVGKPIQVMLGLAAPDIESVIKEFGKVIAEFKYDGMRSQIHKKGDKIWIYTRRLEDVTKQFPDIVEMCKKGLNAEECIVEGEALGIDPKTNRPIPFQRLSQRIHRKYDIEEMVRQIPVQVNLFDIVYLNGEMLFQKPLKERKRILEKVVKPIEGKLLLAKSIETSNLKELEDFYKEALSLGQEGIFLKVMDAPYIFGRHVGGWYKIKPIMETLDLAIIGASWGEGGRAKWLTSYLLACRDPDTGKLLSCGMMSTGLKEEEYEEMTQRLKPLIIKEKGRDVFVKPKIVIEVGYQEIQKSPNYESGFALRFPRFIRLREDKSIEEVDSLDRIKSLYRSKGKKG